MGGKYFVSLALVCALGALLITCKNPVTEPSNNPPYAVAGPAAVELIASEFDPQFVQLLTDAPDLDLDPDGDEVSFKSSTLEDYLLRWIGFLSKIYLISNRDCDELYWGSGFGQDPFFILA